MQLLETDRLLLRPFTLDDAEGLYAYASHPEVGPPAGWRPHRSVEESRQVIENIFVPSDALAVLRKSDGRLIGSAGFVDRHRAELGTPSEEIGYSLARDCWGQGLIPEAVKEIIRHAFADLGYQVRTAHHPDADLKYTRFALPTRFPASGCTKTDPLIPHPPLTHRTLLRPSHQSCPRRLRHPKLVSYPSGRYIYIHHSGYDPYGSPDSGSSQGLGQN